MSATTEIVFNRKQLALELGQPAFRIYKLASIGKLPPDYLDAQGKPMFKADSLETLRRIVESQPEIVA